MKNYILLSIFILITLSCNKKDNLISIDNLPELPNKILSKLDTIKMTTASELKFPTPPEIDLSSAALPCCSIVTYRNMMVRYPFTKCVPYIDRFTYDTNQVVYYSGKGDQGKEGETNYKSINRKIKYYKLEKSGAPRGLMDMLICSTSEGPWNAQLIETIPCSGSKKFELIITAFDELLPPIVWFGGISEHPSEIGLTSCYYMGTLRSKCGGISSCECSSNQCDSVEPCDCNIENQW